ncbi:RNA pseudouridine synthase [Loigolactobacillus backii]|uniref:RluA family pseudouridine synthase n=1 Tax=Loigolactobacillus backii TaxID=375175 RepID=UPI0007F106FC|nr:RluA family pseudouridine synthase [Loigolactobacillus backii]ANK59125.1 RNA pseudouridine synthase [Loigolactobacillus backii]ANK64114.1 RNA pseudouridine synthase [Loigolactobacillus backii]ANK67492.1 RNA pseudouridine synthase [Loigolactobacillus backii]OLF69643.1 pseudouridylate synthase [Loigolactobacillus backii]PIO88215.1 RNA pseudouridine synthase [Loigolactobacillus backii]
MQKWQYHCTVTAAQSGHRLKQYLRRDLLIPKTICYYLRIRRIVRINGRYQSVYTPVKTGDDVLLTFYAGDFSTPRPDYHGGDASLVHVLYENDDLLVVDKPAGIKTHPNRPEEQGTLMSHVTAYLQSPAYVVHRIDRATSGALVVAKNPVVLPILNCLISSKKITRQYRAWVHGHLPARGTINLPIGRDPLDKRKRQVGGPDALTAVTHYRVLQETPTKSLLAIQLETGRTHQIRVQFSYLGHPVVGDPLYDPQAAAYSRLFLHSAKMRLLLPFSFTPVMVTAPLPESFLRLAD